jgi:hypothetical protein
MVAAFWDGLGKAKTLPPGRVKTELTPLEAELVEPLGILGYELEDEAVTPTR